MALPLPDFISRDPAQIVSDMVQYYQDQVGKQLEPAQAEMFIINTFAYRELIVRNDVQSAAMQNLIRFSKFPVIDYLGELVGVSRLAATAASVTISFNLVSGHGGVTLPAGLRVQSEDGKVVYQLAEATPADPVDLVITGKAVAQTAGNIGNGYVVGAINNILDPQPYLVDAYNVDVPAGGANEESDDQLRERIMLAPSSYSVAGPEGAYKYFAKSAHPSIIDVGIGSVTPGTVNVYPLSTAGIPTPTPILEAVEKALTPEDVRPLSDTVVVESPVVVDYDVLINVTLITGADPLVVLPQVEAAANAYIDLKKVKLGLDIVHSQLVAAAQYSDGKKIDGLYSVEVASPAADVLIDVNEVAICHSLTIVNAGSHDA